MELKPKRRGGPGSKLGALLFSLAFALGFGIAGTYSLISATNELRDWWSARSWQPVPAAVTDTSLEAHHGVRSGTTYRALGKYRYRFNGKEYEGTRIGFTKGSDNIGDWQTTQYRRLLSAKKSGTQIQMWVDPQNPTQAIVDRTLRWKHMLFMVPFAVLFPLVGLIAAWFFIKTLITPKEELFAEPHLGSNETVIEASASSSARPLWFFSVIWSLLIFPSSAAMAPKLYAESSPWLLLLALLCSVGLLLLYQATQKTLQMAKNGKATLSLNPQHPQLGNPVRLTFILEREPSLQPCKATLLCESVDSRGEDTRTRTLWRQEKHIQPLGTLAHCQFQLPTNAPASTPASKQCHRWRVELTFPDNKDTRSFDVIVFRNSAMARSYGAPDDVIQTPETGIPASIANVIDEPSRLIIQFNHAPNLKSAIGLMAFGGLFLSIAFWILSRNSGDAIAWMFFCVFGLIATGIILAGVYALIHRFTIRIEHDHLRILNKSLFGTKQLDLAITDINKLTPILRESNKTVGSYRIHATLNNGKDVELTDPIEDATATRQVLRLLQRHINLADTAIGSMAEAGLMYEKHLSTPTIQAAIDRTKKRFIAMAVSLQIFVMIAIAWQFFGQKESSTPQGSPPTSVAQKSNMKPEDQKLFGSLHNVASATRIDEALQLGANINATNDWGATPLIVAAGLGDADDCGLLVRHGADIEFAITADNEYKGRTALIQAARTTQTSTVAWLLSAGADATRTESHGWSAMHYAARNGDIESLREFKKHGVNLDQPSPISRGETPLMIAARSGEIATIKALIEMGADPNLKDRFGENAYGWAKYFKQPAAMSALQAYQ